MVRNRSVPVDTVLPHLTYQDVAEAVTWLSRVFDFTEHYRYGKPGGEVAGAQMFLGSAWIMLNSPGSDSASPAQLGAHTQSLTVFVTDVAAHYDRAKSAGAAIVEDLHETVYGELQYGAVDPEGHHWLFAEHARDVSPAAWGATVASR